MNKQNKKKRQDQIEPAIIYYSILTISYSFIACVVLILYRTLFDLSGWIMHEQNVIFVIGQITMDYYGMVKGVSCSRIGKTRKDDVYPYFLRYFFFWCATSMSKKMGIFLLWGRAWCCKANYEYVFEPVSFLHSYDELLNNPGN